jgi:hypothetical protein
MFNLNLRKLWISGMEISNSPSLKVNCHHKFTCFIYIYNWMKKKEVKLFHHALPSFPNHPPNLKFQGKEWSKMSTITQLMSRIHFIWQESIQWNNLQHRINLWFKFRRLNVEIIHLNNKAKKKKKASYGRIKFRPSLTS